MPFQAGHFGQHQCFIGSKIAPRNLRPVEAVINIQTYTGDNKPSREGIKGRTFLALLSLPITTLLSILLSILFCLLPPLRIPRAPKVLGPASDLSIETVSKSVQGEFISSHSLRIYSQLHHYQTCEIAIGPSKLQQSTALDKSLTYIVLCPGSPGLQWLLNQPFDSI